jgi:glycosyltransferase involved in cell wall biosynthesis
MRIMPHILTEVSAVIATKSRPTALQRTFQSLALQSVQPMAIIVVDASVDSDTRDICERGTEELGSEVQWIKAQEKGAAAQRNQGVTLAKQQMILFFDDDIIFEPNCIALLWQALHAETRLGGASATILNQRYQTPGVPSRLMFTLLNGARENSFAGKVIGPAINLLPEDRDDLPDIVPVEWLNTTCTMYRREALPSPPFDSFFRDYSLMEDLALSIRVAERAWKLANVRRARIFHDSQRGEHKSDVAARAEMELINRHYVMTKVLGKRGSLDYLRLAGWELFQLAALSSSSSGRKQLLSHIAGRLRAARKIVRG